ncbi:MAG: undecaprenyl-phosphate glucose phosphotransferase [Pseudomonadota bacterium]
MDATDYRHSLSQAVIALVCRLALPISAIGTLVMLMGALAQPLTESLKALLIITGLLGGLIATHGPQRILNLSGARLVWRCLIDWTLLTAALLVTGHLADGYRHYDSTLVLAWLALTPLVLLLVRAALAQADRRLHAGGRRARRAVVVGGNALSARFIKQLALSDQPIELQALFDDRRPERFPAIESTLWQGRLQDLADYVESQQIETIVVALPIARLPRVEQALAALHDTTASIYYLPDVTTFDLIQCRTSNVGDMPIVALRESPFYGVRAAAKRFSDVVFASAALMVLSPLLLAIAVAVKRSSPGPVIFKQRRFGLDGREITVYKFRTMTCMEDGQEVRQAERDDDRVTPIGAILRKYSLDELPQFFNVLQGRMSVVGPRPHAVSHNERYRKLIDGYMIRHKVPPGITGLAQVSGMRGETRTVDDMRNRIEFDLAYLRNWSIQLDMQIIWQTIALMFRDETAY